MDEITRIQRYFARKALLRYLLMPMESRVPGNWHARFGKQHRGNTGHAVRPYADFTQGETRYGKYTSRS